MVDTGGLILRAFVTEANCHDGTVGTWLLPDLMHRFERLQKLWADGTYSGQFVEQAQALGLEVEITTRLSERHGFEVIPWRWVVERTFAWLGNYRRLSKDYERLLPNSEAMIYLASINTMLRRIAR